MNARLVCLVSAIALFPYANASDQKKPAGRNGATPLEGDYYIYGGTLGDSIPATANDRKVSMMLSGPLAKVLFDQIGPDKKNACGAGHDQRTRLRGHLYCIWNKGDGYYCYFGLDVLTGKSTFGAIC